MLLVYITSASKQEASAIATLLIEQKLAACVNILPETTSIYFWDNKVQKTEEVILFAKTTENTFERLQKKVQEFHSYETPCIIAIPITNSNPNFLTWVEKTLED